MAVSDLLFVTIPIQPAVKQRIPTIGFSAPSAIGTAGVGFGGQAGAELTDFLVVLNSQSAVKSFMSAGSLSLGGNLSVAVGK